MISTFLDIIRDELKKKQEKREGSDTNSQINIFKASKAKEAFFIASKEAIKIKKKSQISVKLLITRNCLMKNFHRFILACMVRRYNKHRRYSNQALKDLNRTIHDKLIIIDELNQVNNLKNRETEKVYHRSNALLADNVQLKKIINQLEAKIEQDNFDFNNLFNQNVNDIKGRNNIFMIDLTNTIRRNEDAMAQITDREEKLQHKYCVDIRNAIKLNKQLNEIIVTKNKQVHIDIKNISLLSLR